MGAPAGFDAPSAPVAPPAALNAALARRAVSDELASLLGRALVGAPDPAETRALFELTAGGGDALDALCDVAAAVRDAELTRPAEVEAAFNAVVPCRLRPLCLYCPYWREGANEPMSPADVVAGVRSLHDQTDVRQFHLSGGSTRGGEDCGVLPVVEAIRAAGFDDMDIVVNCGASFSDEGLVRLAALKVKRVFSVFETTDPQLFAQMKPGDDLGEKLSFAERIAGAGMEVGTGIMAGLPPRERSWECYARTLCDVAALPSLTAVYVSKFRPAPGIALADKPACALDEARSLVAVARLVLRGVHIRAAAGWSADERGVAAAAGAGSIAIARSFQKVQNGCWQ